MKKLSVLLLINISLIISVFGQISPIELKVLKSEAKMRESDSSMSNVIYTLPAGTQIKTLSLNGGYYKVEYNGKIGYINDMFFQTSGIINNNSSYDNKNANSAIDQLNNNCIEIKYIPASPKPGFENMLKGINYWNIKEMISNGVLVGGSFSGGTTNVKFIDAYIFSQIKKFMEATCPNALYGSHTDKSLSNQLDIVYDNNYGNKVSWSGNLEWISELTLIFTVPGLNYSYRYNIGRFSIIGNNYNNNILYNLLCSKITQYVQNYNRTYDLKLPKRTTCWNELKIKQDFKENGVDKIEGIYEYATSSDSGDAKYKVAVKKIKDKYYLLYLSGANNFTDWEVGEIKASLESTATPNFYKTNWIMADKSENNDFFVSFESGSMNVIDADKNKSIYVKMYPTYNDNVTSFSNIPASGTGFAITSNGLIITNNHVIEGAKTIKVRGINGDFSRVYSAKLITTDKNNDLAIIKIDDYSFANLGTIPYVIKTSGSNVGENIFVLGYPLRATMGDEIKLTNGIISSKSGFQGDVTSYQISAPVQPGNSGGPLFDNQGYLIGIINAKHVGAENASYAIKVSYLTNLIDLLDFPISLQKVSTVSGKPLTQQVSIVKKFVYIVEVN